MPEKWPLGLLIGGLALALLIGRRTTEEAPPDDAPTTGGGSITTIDVRQLRPALLQSHRVSKTLGQSLIVTTGWSGMTRNSRGVGITWRYRLRFDFIGRWQSFSFVAPALFATHAAQNQTSYTFTVPGVPAGLYDLRVFLQAEGSDSIGRGTGVFIDVPGAMTTHFSGINVWTPADPVTFTPPPAPPGPVPIPTPVPVPVPPIPVPIPAPVLLVPVPTSTPGTVAPPRPPVTADDLFSSTEEFERVMSLPPAVAQIEIARAIAEAEGWWEHGLF